MNKRSGIGEFQALLAEQILLAVRGHMGLATLEDIIADVRLETYAPIQTRQEFFNLLADGAIRGKHGLFWVTQAGYKQIPVKDPQIEEHNGEDLSRVEREAMRRGLISPKLPYGW